MLSSTHEGLTSATPEQVYALFSDVTTWPKWNAGVEVHVRHEVKAVSGETLITYRCDVYGAIDEICAEVGRQVSDDFDQVIAALGDAASQ